MKQIMRFVLLYKFKKLQKKKKKKKKKEVIQGIKSKMLKSSEFVESVIPSNRNEMTPIRDSGLGNYFWKNQNTNTTNNHTVEQENKYQDIPYNPYSYSLWQEPNKNKEVLDSIKEKIEKHELTLKILESGHKTTKTEVITCNEKKEDFDQESNNNMSNFIQALENFFKNENDYVNKLKYALTVYKYELKNNRKLKDKILPKENINAELLIFGNLSTIIDLSENFVSTFLQNLDQSQSTSCSDNREFVWKVLKQNKTDTKLKYLDIGKILELHFFKMKQTYLSYFLEYNKQLKYLDSLETSRATANYVREWYSICLTECSISLPDILKLPIKRLFTWCESISDLLLYSDNVLTTENIRSLSGFNTIYIKYLTEVQNEAFIYNNYDQNLPTPVEISNLYQNKWKSQKNLGSTRSETEYLSKTSSKYSDIVTEYYDTNSTSSYTCLDAKQEDRFSEENRSLKELCYNFRNIHKNTHTFRSILQNVDWYGPINKLLKNAIVWQNFMELGQNKSLDDFSIYKSYVEKLQWEKQEIEKLVEFKIEQRLYKPLVQLLVYSETIETLIKDLQILKKTLSKQFHTDEHNIRREALEKEYDVLQLNLLRQLPVFNKYLFSFVNIFLLQYHEILQEYLTILCGGEMFRDRELQLLKNGTRQLGDNFDILQLYSSSRFVTKKVVRENWPYKTDPIKSEIVRRFFEL
ncbi:Fus2p SCDLUD_000813 [Saccharomycodes ludwigii]|uniref:Fus2p n=1 Tax=Saccharomycodes ludwigii TaxID=36035 RepID=UPI001E84DCD0|nr:hypothetical protein SCDLUD_000813 [Saccharomycodes ludwigii]KAH3903195.1 hypothetical protein SCDLUD_000813 [Saccharomycodes ludwigii]